MLVWNYVIIVHRSRGGFCLEMEGTFWGRTHGIGTVLGIVIRFEELFYIYSIACLIGCIVFSWTIEALFHAYETHYIAKGIGTTFQIIGFRCSNPLYGHRCIESHTSACRRLLQMFVKECVALRSSENPSVVRDRWPPVQEVHPTTKIFHGHLLVVL